jgi:2'-5' RNA ligase/GNAT superfamily N-acetyltransferase
VARWRVAVAVLLPPPAAGEVEGLRRALGDRQLGRVAPHITLVPPVNVRTGDLEEVLRLVRAAAASAPALAVELGPVQTFAPVSPVLYLAVRPAEPLAALRQVVRAGPLDREDVHPFVPHVTVDIEAPADRIDAAMVALGSYSRRVELTAVTLLREDGRGDARRWKPIADADLGRPAVVGRGGIELEITAGTIVDPVTLAAVDPDTAAGPGIAAAVASTVAAADPDLPVRHDLVLTAHRDGRPVGVATATRQGSDLVLTGLAVAPEHRRLGVARALLAQRPELRARPATLPADVEAVAAHLGRL